MKPRAYFINVGSGETVDEAALIEALEQRRIAGAGLDVFAAEPLPAASPLCQMTQVFIALHIAPLETAAVPARCANNRPPQPPKRSPLHPTAPRQS
jgi:phosphoglycerate dehydrogenase-like enzyme